MSPKQAALDAGALCMKCPFKDRKIAYGIGDTKAKIAVVSRSPGYYEAQTGKVFSGPSGKILDHLLTLQGVKREDVRATNVVLCESDGPDAEPDWNLAVACCGGRLENEIVDAETVIAAGNEAAASILDETGIGALRGYEHIRDNPMSGEKQRVIVTNNPAVVLRDDGAFPEMVRDFRLAINPLPRPKLPSVRIIDELNEGKLAAEAMLKAIEPGMIVACDFETRGELGVKKSGLRHTAEIVCAGFSIRPERAVVFGEKCTTDMDFISEYLYKLLTIPQVTYLWHNGKFDTKIARYQGIPARVDADTLLLSYATDERPGNPESGAGGHSLEWLLKDELGWPRYEPASVQRFKKSGVIESDYARKELYQYNGMDTAGSLGLYPILLARAIADNVYEKPYKSMWLPRLNEALTKIELQGTFYNVESALDILEDEMWPILSRLRSQMGEISKRPGINPNSYKQLIDLYYYTWHLQHNLNRPKIERKGKISTDKEVREEIIKGDFVVNETRVHRDTVGKFTVVLKDFKTLDTQRGTFLEGLILKRYSDGRLYPNFKIHGTESGRLSASEPNIQNITRPKEGLPNIRRVFIPDPGCVFISADLSQAELRAIAVLSGDNELQSVYLDTNRSLHKEVATQFYGKDYTYEQYVRAKNINFSVVYWISAFSLTQLYKVPADEAQKFIDFWWERFPGVYDWTKSIESKVINDGELQSPFGHKRRFYVIPSDRSARSHLIKEGINFLPQNIASQITLWAMCNLCDKLDWNIAQPRINVHDNIVVNCKRSYVPAVAKMMKQEMENAVKEAIGWDFPFLAELSVGDTWGDLEDYVLD